MIAMGRFHTEVNDTQDRKGTEAHRWVGATLDDSLLGRDQVVEP